MAKDYTVGYGKPPKSHQFQPGKSGNPSGRAKGAKGLKSDLAAEMAEMIPIKEGGKAKKVSKQRALLKALTAKAVQGNPRAANVILGLVLKLLQSEAGGTNIADLLAADQHILEAFTNAMSGAQTGQKTPSEGTS
jgi:hypothetical protein